MCKPIAKATFCVTNAAEAPKIMREAFRIAREGKPGPVVIDLPLDIQMSDVEYDETNDFSLPIAEVIPDLSQIKKSIDLLLQAKDSFAVNHPLNAGCMSINKIVKVEI